MVMGVALLGVSQLLARTGWEPAATSLSSVTQPVVYLHYAINFTLYQYYHLHYSNLVAALIGLAAPVLISKLVLDCFALTRLLFRAG